MDVVGLLLAVTFDEDRGLLVLQNVVGCSDHVTGLAFNVDLDQPYLIVW